MAVVEATFVACGLHGTKDELALEIEAAMVAAIERAQAEGLSDPAQIRARILAARAAVLAE